MFLIICTVSCCCHTEFSHCGMSNSIILTLSPLLLSTTEDDLPVGAETVQTAKDNDGELLHLHLLFFIYSVTALFIPYSISLLCCMQKQIPRRWKPTLQ